MTVLKIVVPLDGHEIEAYVTEGVMASVELGNVENEIKNPKHRVNIMPALSGDKHCAWVQVLNFDGDVQVVSQEGMLVLDSKKGTQSLLKGKVTATMELATTPAEKISRCMERTAFDDDDCCTFYGPRGCYVECCGSCCRDNVGCFGAGCCP